MITLYGGYARPVQKEIIARRPPSRLITPLESRIAHVEKHCSSTIFILELRGFNG